MLRDKILELIETDDSYTSRQDRQIIMVYKNSSGETKETIDDLFIALTGLSLKTIINEVDNETE